MEAKKINKYAPAVKRQAQIVSGVRHILIASLGAGLSLSAFAAVEAVKFNSAFIHGLSVDVSQYYQGNPIPAGEFSVLVAVNGEARGQHKVLFKPQQEQGGVQPCFNRAQLARFGIKPTGEPAPEERECAVIEKWVSGAEASYQAGDFYLDLLVPQAYLVHYPRGYTDPASWDAGVPVGLLDYNANFYVQHSSGPFSDEDNSQRLSGNLGVLAGLNFFDWRFRKRINTSWLKGSAAHTRSLYTRLQRDIPVLKSQLTLGDSTTGGDLFDSLTVRGIQLQSDDRMQPDGLRYYTPLVRGIAESNAKVRVTQRGQTLYETTVPPGPFELGDIGAMGFGGDLQVTITEADGRERTQTIPFSAPPMLLRNGISRFGVTLGKLQDDSLREEPGMVQAFYQYGLGNMYTLYGGGQLADNYAALGIGHAFNTPLGGISMDATRAHSELQGGKVSAGNSFNIGFSKYLDATSTDVTLAAYRYSSKGFYSLRDAIVDRYGVRDDLYRVDYRARQRFTVSVGQPLWNGSRLNFAGNFYNYWDDRSSSSQYMLSYNQSERYFSWALSASRSFNSDGRDVNSVTLSVSVPLGRGNIIEKPLFSTLYTSVSHDNDGSSALQANAIGSQGAQNELNYGVGSSLNKSRRDATRTAFNGNLNYNSPFGQFGATASLGNKARQLSFSANGSLVAHEGGLTAGPRIGDYPFALVNAPGAEGARMLNGYGSRIDANGYAVVPSLTPYRENTVAVNTVGLPATVDVLESESTVIPRMGAAVKVQVKTQVGDPVVLVTRDAQGDYLPIGTDIVDEGGTSLGIVGQGGMAFIRGWHADKQNLYVKDASGARICTIYANSKTAEQIMRAFGSVTQVEVLCH